MPDNMTHVYIFQHHLLKKCPGKKVHDSKASNKGVWACRRLENGKQMSTPGILLNSLFALYLCYVADPVNFSFRQRRKSVAHEFACDLVECDTQKMSDLENTLRDLTRRVFLER